jgi:hypothetical protein
MKAKLLRLFFIVVLSLLSTQPVYAQRGQPPQYDKTIVGSHGEIYYVEYFEEVRIIQSPVSMLSVDATLASGCKSRTNGENIYNAFGALLARYQQKVDWCYDGTKITSVSHVHTPTVYAPGWVYNGLIGHSHWGGVNQASFRAYSQASFCLNLGVCTQYWYPWVDQTVYGTGNSSGSSGS